MYIYRNTIVSYEMAKTLCDILSTRYGVNLVARSSSSAQNTATIVRNEGIQTFNTSTKAQTLSEYFHEGVEMYSGHQIVAGDFNDDGIQDVVYGSYGEGLKGISPHLEMSTSSMVIKYMFR